MTQRRLSSGAEVVRCRGLDRSTGVLSPSNCATLHFFGTSLWTFTLFAFDAKETIVIDFSVYHFHYLNIPALPPPKSFYDTRGSVRATAWYISSNSGPSS